MRGWCGWGPLAISGQRPREKPSLFPGHPCYLFLLGARTRQAGPGARGPRPILWSRGFRGFLDSPHRLCFREELQARVAPGALDNLPVSVGREVSVRGRKACRQSYPWGMGFGKCVTLGS